PCSLAAGPPRAQPRPSPAGGHTAGIGATGRGVDAIPGCVRSGTERDPLVRPAQYCSSNALRAARWWKTPSPPPRISSRCHIRLLRPKLREIWLAIAKPDRRAANLEIVRARRARARRGHLLGPPRRDGGADRRIRLRQIDTDPVARRTGRTRP